MPATPRTQKELKSALKHVLYEMEMLACPVAKPDRCRRTFRIERDLPEDQRWEANAFLESFLLHARILADFFRKLPWGSENGPDNNFPVAGKEDDIVAAEYSQTRYPIKDPVSRCRDDINKKLAHLSFKRTRHEWKAAEFDGLIRECLKFLETLPPDYPGKQVKHVRTLLKEATLNLTGFVVTGRQVSGNTVSTSHLGGGSGLIDFQARRRS